MQNGILQDLAGFCRSHLIEKRHARPNRALGKELHGDQSGTVRSTGKMYFPQLLKNLLVDDISPFFN